VGHLKSVALRLPADKINTTMPYMSTYPPPPESKREVNRSGKAIAAGEGTDQDLLTVDQVAGSTWLRHQYVSDFL